MTCIGLPVPPGFTITTETCADVLRERAKAAGRADGRSAEERRACSKKNRQEVRRRQEPAARLGSLGRRRFDAGHDEHDPEPRPERRSRSRAWPAPPNNERFAYDTYRRLINMFGDVVMGVDHEHFEAAFDKIKKKYNVKLDTDVPTEGMIELVRGIQKGLSSSTSASRFPAGSVRAARTGRSKPCSRAGCSHARSSIARSKTSAACSAPPSTCNRWSSATWAMTRGTGVAFTRNPSTGENKFYGEFLVNAQGEDVVAGIRTPQPVDRDDEVEQEGLQATARDQEHARKALQGHAGHRVHHRDAARCTCCKLATASAPAPRP